MQAIRGLLLYPDRRQTTAEERRRRELRARVQRERRVRQHAVRERGAALVTSLRKGSFRAKGGDWCLGHEQRDPFGTTDRPNSYQRTLEPFVPLSIRKKKRTFRFFKALHSPESGFFGS